jgi:hypothetical protein
MTRYLVIWAIDALDQLTLMWIDGPDRDAITHAQDHIDGHLTVDPRKLGQPLSEGLWKIAVHPLVALYEIDDAGGVVRITGVGRLD